MANRRFGPHRFLAPTRSATNEISPIVFIVFFSREDLVTLLFLCEKDERNILSPLTQKKEQPFPGQSQSTPKRLCQWLGFLSLLVAEGWRVAPPSGRGTFVLFGTCRNQDFLVSNILDYLMISNIFQKTGWSCRMKPDHGGMDDHEAVFSLGKVFSTLRTCSAVTRERLPWPELVESAISGYPKFWDQDFSDFQLFWDFGKI